MPLTTKELSALEEQLSAEQMLVRKYNSYANLATDPQIKTKCQQYASEHQKHYNKLLTYLN